MLNTNERVKKLIEEAMNEGIHIENIRAYLKLNETPKDNDKDIMDRLYQENSVMPWDLAFFRDTDVIIDEMIANNKNDVEFLEITSETLIDTIEIDEEINNSKTQEQIIEEKSLIVPKDINIFRRIISFCAKIMSRLNRKEENC